MKILIRAVPVGAAIGAAEAYLFFHGPDDDFAGIMTMFLATFPLGALLCWAVRLPRWGLVASVAPFVMIVFDIHLSDFVMPESPSGTLSDEWLRILPSILASVAGYPLVAWLASRRSLVPGTVAVGVIFLSVPVVMQVDEVRYEADRARTIESSGVPLIAPMMPGYRLTAVDEWGAPGVLGLSYERWTYAYDNYAGVTVYVRPATADTPRAACARPYPDWDYETPAPCRQAAGGVWVRTEAARRTVFAQYGDALVQVESHEASENELLAVLPRFHPISAGELAAAG